MQSKGEALQMIGPWPLIGPWENHTVINNSTIAGKKNGSLKPMVGALYARSLHFQGMVKITFRGKGVKKGHKLR